MTTPPSTAGAVPVDGHNGRAERIESSDALGVQATTVAEVSKETAQSAATEYLDPPAYLGEALEDAERLLKYAAEVGIEVEDAVRDGILHARAVGSGRWNEQTAASLLESLTKLAARLRPVTAESLKGFSSGTHSIIRSYWQVAIGLAVVIVPFSLASFVSSAISTSIRTDIATANDLAVKLRAQLGPPPLAPTAGASSPGNASAGPPASPPIQGGGESDILVVTELQQFASAIRSIDARARQLNWLVFRMERDPFESIRNDPREVHRKFQLPSGLRNYAAAADERTLVYQDVRYFGQNVLDDVSFAYSAITTCLLPVLYALLGTCAYLLRSLDEQVRDRTFTPSVANSARFLIAAIGGAVVGLFNNFTITQGASIPPLAIAFLVGYAVDVFFAFLEGLLQAFSKTRPNRSSLAPTSSSS